MSLDAICSGFMVDLLDKSPKKRWFLLKDLFLFEYQEQPAEGKNTAGLKGLYFLPSCSLKPEGETPKDQIILISGAEEKRLGPGAEPEPDKYILSWKNSLEYVIKRAALFKAECPSIDGWLKKRGGLGHQHKNQKSRHFVLQGNLIGYYADVRKNEHDIASLKGFIEVSSIVSLTTALEGKPLDFSILTNGGKEYIMTAKDADEKRRWTDAINTCIHTSIKYSLPVTMDPSGTREVVVKIGKLQRIIKGKPVPSWFALSNLNLRFYGNEVTQESLERDIGADCLGTIPVLGVYVRNDPTLGILTIFDLGGNSYAISCKEKDELRKWEEVITKAAKQIAQKTVAEKRSLRMNCFLLPETADARSKGYCMVIASRYDLKFIFLMLKREIVVRMKHLKSIDMADDDLLAIRYKKDDEDLKQLNLKCKNASGIFDSLEALFELYGEDPPSDDEREEKQRREDEAKAIKEKLKHSGKKKKVLAGSVSGGKRSSVNEPRPNLGLSPDDIPGAQTGELKKRSNSASVSTKKRPSVSEDRPTLNVPEGDGGGRSSAENSPKRKKKPTSSNPGSTRGSMQDSRPTLPLTPEELEAVTHGAAAEAAALPPPLTPTSQEASE